MLFWKILFFVEYSFSIRLPVSDKTVSIDKNDERKVIPFYFLLLINKKELNANC